MDLEAWLDGYDRRKNDILSWCDDEGGDHVLGVRVQIEELREALKRIRRKVQSDAASADLARLDALLGEAVEEIPAEPAPAARAAAPAAPAPARVAPMPAPVAPAPARPALPAPTPAPFAAATPPVNSDPAAGILKSLAWMDSHAPEPPAPSPRSRTSSRPAVLDMFARAAPPAPAAPAPAPAAPAPAARTPAPAAPAPTRPETVYPKAAPPAAPAPTSSSSVLDSIFGRDPSPAEAAPSAPARPSSSAMLDAILGGDSWSTVVARVASAPEPTAPAPRPAPAAPAPRPAPAAPAPRPAPASFESVFRAAPAPSAPPAEASPRRKRKPIVIDCPQGEERRAALADVGVGPDVPFVIHAVIEVPRGGGTGYVYDDSRDLFVVVDHPTAERVPALGHVAYGFIPETVSDDGAHLDAFILSSGAAGPGELLRVRALGYLRRADGDHKLICVPETHGAQALADIPPTILKTCETWKNPTGVSGGTWCDGEKARDLIRRCAS